jgi:hypothetical protein
MTSLEVSEWQAYAVLSGGLRDRRQEIQSAQLCTLFANAHRKKGAPPFRVQDFMPPDPDLAEPPRQSITSLASYLSTRATE